MTQNPHHQRTLLEARANDYPHVERGMTLGTVCEHRASGTWVAVTDLLDDGRVRVLDLDEVTDTTVKFFETAAGCVEHAQLAREVARTDEGTEYLAPPDRFEVLGPTHPDHQRDSVEADANV